MTSVNRLEIFTAKIADCATETPVEFDYGEKQNYVEVPDLWIENGNSDWWGESCTEKLFTRTTTTE